MNSRRARLVKSLTLACVLALPAPGVSQEPDPHAGLQGKVVSEDCLVCHDPFLTPYTSSHPVGVNYQQVWREGRAALRPIQDLDRAIALERGQLVGCTSCHDIKTRTPGLLSMPMAGSALCFACHDR